MTSSIAFRVNGRAVAIDVDPMRRLSAVLRDDLGLIGTKVGCDAGDCGACTVRLDRRQVCACLVPAAQAEGTDVRTVEGLALNGHDGAALEFDDLGALQRAFLESGAAQCGICTPGMLMAADDTLDRHPGPTDSEILDGLGGVLCRCTGYRKILDAVQAAAADGISVADRNPASGRAVGARLPKVDGIARVTGAAEYGADARAPAGDGPMLTVRAVRSPYARARFTIGDLGPLAARHPGLVRVLTAADIPGQNRYGIYDTSKDQPALAEGFVRHRGEAVAALVGEEAVLDGIADAEVPIAWEPLEPLTDMRMAAEPGAPLLHDHAEGNVLIRGRLATGEVDAGLAGAPASAEVDIETTWVEHAYIEPEAGYARRVGDRIEVVVSTQAPYMDRDEVALLLGIRPDQVRIVPTACGGGFGGKLDLGVHPLIAVAAWLTGRPVRAVWTRPESMAASPKRHPASIRASATVDREGALRSMHFHGDFDTGAYGSWGKTVANRVPVHAMGPYRVPAVLATTRAIHTNNPIAGAFRGFGVPQAAIAHETLMDDLATKLGIDRLEIRARNALRAGDTTPSSQRLAASAGLLACLDALRPVWVRERAAVDAWNAAAKERRDPRRRGVGIGAMWYGIGNTALANPSAIEMGVDADGTVTLYCGAVDIGQGASTVMVQIAADALGVPAGTIRLVSGDTDRTKDAGKSSASRQTFVSGNAARLAGEDLRRQLLALAEVGEAAHIELGGGQARFAEDERPATIIHLTELPPVRGTDVLLGSGTYDPHTTPLDADGQGVPYETYAFGAQVAAVDVDTELGTTTVLGIVAAHDVGRAINPTQVEGQIHGGIAQGLGFALMEAYVPGRTENLHDYLIPTIGDVPQIECILVEDAEPAGPYGAKGVGEPALVPTAPAILGAIRDATGARLTSVPATPERVLAGIAAAL